MKTFLEYVAEDICKKYGTNLSNLAVVFPNKRASLFLNEALYKIADAPLWAPTYLTISDLFRQQSNLLVADQIKLVCDLHKVYTQCTGSDEELDRFYGWGEMMLADFDDIDKNMADAQDLFNNMRDLTKLNQIDYLTEEQRKAIEDFFGDVLNNNDSPLKQEFLNIWDHLYEIYVNYNKLLTQEGLAYEGALYRMVVESDRLTLPHDHYIFVGFNLLHTVEKKLFKRIREEGKATFYWDYDKHYLKNHEAGQYIAQHLIEFPNELDNDNDEIYNNFDKLKTVTFASASTEDIQARYINKWLSEEEESSQRMKAGRKAAIVMCDESLLKTVIHCVPPVIKKVNVTTGYPLSQAPISTFVKMLISMQMNRTKDSEPRYKLHFVSMVLRHPYAKAINSDADALDKYLKESFNYYPTAPDLYNFKSQNSEDSPKANMENANLKLLFSDVSHNGKLSNKLLLQWLSDLIKLIGTNSKDNTDQLFQESLFRMYTLVNRLLSLVCDNDLNVSPITMQQLLSQLINSTTVPFHGKPAEGLQIMGVLETRNLDFDHLLILSCNEGNMPKGINDSSFIPYMLRKAAGLTTVDNKVSIYAYYFFRLLQRAKDVTILYNDSTDNGKQGEMSRFMLQLMLDPNKKCINKSLQATQQPCNHLPKDVIKQGKILKKLKLTQRISPSNINMYLRCPLQFLYNKIQGIIEPDEMEEDEIDMRTFGNIFHKAAENIYRSLSDNGQTITRESLTALKNDKIRLESFVDDAFKTEFFRISDNSEKQKKNIKIEYNGLQYIYRETILDYINSLLSYDLKFTPFKIHALEQEIELSMALGESSIVKDITLNGCIDRLDEIMLQDGTSLLRVIDYKTGKFDNKSPKTLNEIFDPKTDRAKHPDYYLQSTLYSCMVRTNETFNSNHLEVSPALLFVQNLNSENYNPILSLDKEVITASEIHDEFMSKIKSLLEEIYNLDVPFSPTNDRGRCNQCPYKRMCY